MPRYRVHIASASSYLLDQEQELLSLPLVLCSHLIMRGVRYIDKLHYFSVRKKVFAYQGFIQDFELGGEQDGSRMIVVCESTLMCT